MPRFQSATFPDARAVSLLPSNCRTGFWPTHFTMDGRWFYFATIIIFNHSPTAAASVNPFSKLGCTCTASYLSVTCDVRLQDVISWREKVLSEMLVEQQVSSRYIRVPYSERDMIHFCLLCLARDTDWARHCARRCLCVFVPAVLDTALGGVCVFSYQRCF